MNYNIDQISNLLNQLTTYFNVSRRNPDVLPSGAIEFLKSQLTESSYLSIKEKFLIINGDQTFGLEFLTDRQTPDKIWLQGEISKADKSRELFLMDWVISPALWQLLLKYPEISENPNSLTSKNVEMTTKQIRRKFPPHYKDIYPFITLPPSFSVEKSDLSTENVTGCQIVTLINSKLKNFLNDPNFIKVIGSTVKSLQVDNELVPWYLPVIHCYHPPTRFNLMITIPSLEFLSCFALDDDQYKIFLDYHFVAFQQTENRQIDKLLELINNGDDKIKGYFPESFFYNPKIDGEDIVSCLLKSRLKNQQKKDL